jgi:MHS family proline/betaine transporter-like MFS transporter
MSFASVGVNPLLRPSSVRAIIAACIGNTLEWYDFIVYTAFAVQISHAFFPGKSDFTSLMATLITFGVGFFARPFGAALLGAYADRAGRKTALTLTVLLMACGSFMIAVCPTAATIGIAAPIILFFARLLQGFSAGGEIGGAIALLAEDAPVARRAFYAAFQSTAQGAAFVLCGLVALIVTSCFSSSAVNAWAWRLPFLLGIAIAPVGFYIRRHIAEPELFTAQKRNALQEIPIRLVFTKHLKSLLIGMGVVVVGTVVTYITLYLPTYAHQVLKISQSNGYAALIIVGMIAMASPVAGMLADRFSRRVVMLLTALCFIVYPYPAFYYLSHHASDGTFIAIQASLAILMWMYEGPSSALLSELFPTVVRSTGTALAYGLSVAIFGGFTPAIISALVKYTGNNLSVAYWLMLSAVLSTVSLLAVQDRSRSELY